MENVSHLPKFATESLIALMVRMKEIATFAVAMNISANLVNVSPFIFAVTDSIIAQTERMNLIVHAIKKQNLHAVLEDAYCLQKNAT